jgi:hypothetical protein
VRARGYLRVWWVPWRVGVSMCVRACSLPYPACNAYAPYCPLWRFCLYHIFRHYVINVTIFGKKLLYIKCVFWFSLELIWNISYSKKKSARYCHKCENVFMWSTRYFLSDFNEVLTFSADFEESLNIKFYPNSSNGSPVVPCGQTDGQTWQS